MFKYVRFEEVQDEYSKVTFLQKNEDVKVNFFDKPIVSIEADDENLIDELISFQDERINCIEITKDEFRQIFKLTSQYQRILDVSAEVLDKATEPIKKEYPLEERESFFLQIDEAQKFIASNDETVAPYLKGLAEDEGDTVENFADSVIAKNEVYKVLHQTALSEKRRVKRELMSVVGA